MVLAATARAASVNWLWAPASMAADATTSLVADDLREKLAEFDARVAAFRQEMVDDFVRYSDRVLEELPASVSDAVSRAIAESLSNYPSLYPGPGATAAATAAADDDDDEDGRGRDGDDGAPAAGRRRRWNGSKSPPPILYHTSGVPKDDPRGASDPHDREQEFHGVFTPSYLPLLDGYDRPPHSPTVSPTAAAAPGDDANNTGDAPHSPDALALTHLVRPPPVRRPTDSSSVESSGSESKVRRSAMRRSSSASNRASPRRVRFDVQGEEVLPTASPQASAVALPYLGYDSPSRGLARDSHPGLLSPGQVADDEDLPPARKVSSSERLRAMSKMPLEDPAMWTVVNSQTADESAALEDYDNGGAPPAETAASRLASQRSAGKAPAKLAGAAAAAALESAAREPGSPGQPLEGRLATYDDSDSSDDDFVSMRSSRKSSFAHPPATSSMSQVGALAEPTAADSLSAGRSAEAQGGTNGNNPNPAPADEDEDEDEDAASEQGADSQGEDDQLFDFDEDKVGYPLTRVAKAATKPDPPPANSDSEPEDGRETPRKGLSISPQAASPPRSASPPVAASVGSYRGRQINIFNVVKDYRVHDRAAELGDFNTFVGSVDGRTGIDGADLSSFRASLSNAQYSGTPRSLSERLVMEDAQEELRRGREGR